MQLDELIAIICRESRKQGALEAAAEIATSLLKLEEPDIEQAIWVLQRAISHDGSEDFFEHTGESGHA
jgi:hypothetical protein